MTRTVSPGRRRRARVPFAAVAAAGAMLVAACGSTGTSSDAVGAPPPPGFPVTVESCGRPLTVDAPPERVVILSPVLARDLVALGLADRIVGQSGTNFFAPPPETADVPVLNPDRNTASEVILGAAPDLVISEGAYRFDPASGGVSPEQLGQAGVAAMVSGAGCTDNNTGTVDDQFADLEKLGRIFGVEPRAQALAADLRGRLAAVEGRVANLPRPLVFSGPLDGGQYYPVAGIGLDALRRACGESIFPGIQNANAVVSTEEVTARDPQQIVSLVSEPGSFDRGAQLAGLRSAFPTTSAVTNGRIDFLDYYATATPGSAVQIVEGVEQWASVLHPTAFGG